MKKYDRSYYHRWYRDPETRVAGAETTARKAHLALSAAEFMLGRKVESVLDVGAGEGLWHTALKRMRPRISYMGIDPSEYVVARFGKSRNLALGSFGDLPRLKLRREFDLIVCADVLQYVEDDDLARGLREIRKLLGGVAYLESYAAEDSMEGDRDGWIDRPERVLRRFFEKAGLSHCGMYCWIDERKITSANRFELA